MGKLINKFISIDSKLSNMKRGIILMIVILIFLVGCNLRENSYSYQIDQLKEYPLQTQELCESGGAGWIEFSSGCHDECVYERWSSKIHYSCTEALSYGCDCGLDKCWNGNSCELN